MSAPTPSSVFRRAVLPAALVPPLMILFAMRDHPLAYRLQPDAANWEWIALVVFVAELAAVALQAGMIRLTAATGQLPPSRARALLIAARSAAPLWASAVVLAVPSLAALIVVHILAHAVALRTLYRDLRDDLQMGTGVQALHRTYMVYSVPVVLWIPLLLMIFVSLGSAG